jgi:hypothetical protein
VTGTVTADDTDPLTYTLNSAPTKGLVKIDAVTGAFAYVPDVDARYAAQATPNVDTDTFTVTITDSTGLSTTATVHVQIAPPSATSIDQRSTSVAVAATDMYFYTQDELNQAFNAMQGSGITSIRVMLPWAGIEPTNDVWQWTAADRVINTAYARGFEVLAVLNSPPGWAVAPGTAPISGRPASPQEFAEFAGAVATRYQGKIAAYQIHNEVNSVTFWGPQPSAAQYAELLKAVYPVLKAADPNAVVVAAGLAPLLDFGSWTVNPVRFVEQMYGAGAGGYFDALAYHPYTYGSMFSQTSPTYMDSPVNQMNRIYQVMVANGDGNKKIWASEYGQPSNKAGDASQAEYLADFLRAWRDLDYAGPAFIHTLRDYESDDPDADLYGLFRLDWTPRLAWGEVLEVIEENQDLVT